LIIRYENREERALKNMAMYGSLEEIVIYEARVAKKEMIKFYIETFPELTKLEIHCENDFDKGCIEKLMSKLNPEKILKVSYGCNYYRNLAHLDERKHFPEDNRKEREIPLNNKETSMLMTLPNLQNIWIDVPEIDIITKLKEMKNLKMLALGRMDSEGENLKL
jgi:hypothetical protein